MKIVHISTTERAGGAAIAAARLHVGLRRAGHQSTLLVRDRSLDDPVADTLTIRRGEQPALTSPVLQRLLGMLYSTYLRAAEDGAFSTDLPTYDFAELPVVREADIINVHWVSEMLSVPALRRIQDLGKPIVWTLHDQLPFTGGCHYSGACDRFEAGCQDCPRLRHEAGGVPSLVLEHKRTWLDPRRLTVVAPSQWLAERARRSLLFRDARVHAIPNAVPVSAYQHLSRADARRRLALPDDALVVILGAQHLGERRKGYEHVVDALGRLAAGPTFRARLANRSLVIAAFGVGHVVEGDIPVLRLGGLVGDDQVASAFRAADLFVLPTLEDNLPNTLLESIAAGTPVVAYAVGGVPDILGSNGCGVLVQRGDIPALASAMGSLIDDLDALQRMRSQCEAFARTALDLPVQAAAYVRLYDELLESDRAAAPNAALPSPPDTDNFAASVAESEDRLFDRLLAQPGMVTLLLGDCCARLDDAQATTAACDREIRSLRGRVSHLEALIAARDRERAARAVVAQAHNLPGGEPDQRRLEQDAERRREREELDALRRVVPQALSKAHEAEQEIARLTAQMARPQGASTAAPADRPTPPEGGYTEQGLGQR